MFDKILRNQNPEKILASAQQLGAAGKLSEAAREYERVLQITEDGQKLAKDQLLQVFIGMLITYAMLKQPGRVRAVAERGLERFPANKDFLEPCLLAAEDQGLHDIAETAAGRFLDMYPENEELRVKWKKARKGQGKDFFSSLPKDQKKAAYRRYKEVLNDKYLENISGHMLELKNARDLSDYSKTSSSAEGWAKAAAASLIQAEFQVSAFSLSLIISEGETNNWDVGTAAILKPDPMSRRPMRDSLHCPYCHQFSSPPYWPIHGDTTAFFYSSAEDIDDDLRDPEHCRKRALKMPVICLGCSKTWFVFWEDDPDNPIGTHFIRHINSTRQQIPEIASLYVSFIDDQVLGQIVEQIRNYSADAILSSKSIWNKSIFHNEILHWITVVPSANPEHIKQYFSGGYLASLDEPFKLARAPENDLTFVNWILGLEENHIFTEIGYYPNKADRTKGQPMLFPVDLLVMEERRQIGL